MPSKATTSKSGRATPKKEKPAVATPTPASEWRKPAEDGFPLTLPSGKTATVRRTLDVIDMMKSGKIPNILKGVVAEAIQTGDVSKLDESKLDASEISDMFSLVGQIVIGMMISPKVLPAPEKKDGEQDWEYKIRLEQTEPPDGYIWLTDVDPEDQMFLFQVAQGGTTDVLQFREEQAASLGGLLNGSAVPGKARRAARPGQG